MRPRSQRRTFRSGPATAPSYEHHAAWLTIRRQATPPPISSAARPTQAMAAHWPHEPVDNPIATSLTARPKYVATRTLHQQDLQWTNCHLIDGDLVEAVQRLKVEGGGERVSRDGPTQCGAIVRSCQKMRIATPGSPVVSPSDCRGWGRTSGRGPRRVRNGRCGTWSPMSSIPSGGCWECSEAR